MVKWLARFAPPAVAAVMLALVVTGGPLAVPARTIAIACIVGSTIAALLIRRPDVRTHATVALAVGAFVASGQIRAGGRYALGSTIFVGIIVACLRIPRTSGARAPLSDPARRRAAVMLAASSFAMGGLLVWQLPRLGAMIEQRVARWLGQLEAEEVTGFASTMRLGSTHGMLRSDRIVLRVEGDLSQTEYLRGAVYDRYYFGEWSSVTDAPPRTTVAATLPADQATTRIVFSRGARVAQGIDARWFLPANACAIGTPSGKITFDRAAVAHPEPGVEPTALWLRGGDCSSPPAAASPPDPLDLDLDPNIATDVRGAAREWTADLGPNASDRAKLDAIEHHLASFGYSLDVRRNARYDAIVDFLRFHREGHCELFASAMALLARAQGIPTRVVTGYRGGDFNRVGGYVVVRERNAHAWVEAWVDGKWRAFDPTPPIEGMRRETTGLASSFDVVAYALDRGIVALGQITLLQWGIGLGVALLVLYFVREITRLLERRRKRASRTVFGEVGPSLPAFDDLTDVLTAAGHTRAASEPLEAFARRLFALDVAWARTVADAVTRYAALRYGNEGDERDVVGALERAAAVARRSARSTASRAPNAASP